MGSLFGGSAPKPTVDPELERQRQEAEAKAKADKAAADAAAAEEEAARQRGLRGRIALTTNNLIGYSRGLDTLSA